MIIVRHFLIWRSSLIIIPVTSVCYSDFGFDRKLKISLLISHLAWAMFAVKVRQHHPLKYIGSRTIKVTQLIFKMEPQSFFHTHINLDD